MSTGRNGQATGDGFKVHGRAAAKKPATGKRPGNGEITSKLIDPRVASAAHQIAASYQGGGARLITWVHQNLGRAIIADGRYSDAQRKRQAELPVRRRRRGPRT